MTITENRQDDMLAIRQEIVALVEDPEVTKDAILERLQALHTHTDEAGQKAIEKVWKRVEKLVFTSNFVTGVAVGAVYNGRLSNAQRDQVVHELDKLARAVATRDEEHPRVGRLVEQVRDETEANLIERTQENAYTELVEEVGANLRKLLGLDEYLAGRLAVYFVYGHQCGYTPFPPGVLLEIGEAVAERLADQ